MSKKIFKVTLGCFFDGSTWGGQTNRLVSIARTEPVHFKKKLNRLHRRYSRNILLAPSWGLLSRFSNKVIDSYTFRMEYIQELRLRLFKKNVLMMPDTMHLCMHRRNNQGKILTAKEALDILGIQNNDTLLVWEDIKHYSHRTVLTEMLLFNYEDEIEVFCL